MSLKMEDLFMNQTGAGIVIKSLLSFISEVRGGEQYWEEIYWGLGLFNRKSRPERILFQGKVLDIVGMIDKEEDKVIFSLVGRVLSQVNKYGFESEGFYKPLTLRTEKALINSINVLVSDLKDLVPGFERLDNFKDKNFREQIRSIVFVSALVQGCGGNIPIQTVAECLLTMLEALCASKGIIQNTVDLYG